MAKRTAVKASTVEDGATAVPVAPTKCACGCGDDVVRTFKQGHDQRLVSKLAEDLVTGSGTGMGIVPKSRARDDIQSRIDEVTTYVTKRLSPGLATKVRNAAMLRWALEDKRITKRAETKSARRPKETNQTAVAPTESVQEPDEPMAQDPESNGYELGAPVEIKVGRFVYNATVSGMNQVGKVTAVTYTNRAGTERTITDSAKIQIVV